MMINNWSVHETDSKDGSPTCLDRVSGDYIYFLTHFSDGWHVESKVRGLIGIYTHKIFQQRDEAMMFADQLIASRKEASA